MKKSFKVLAVLMTAICLFCSVSVAGAANKDEWDTTLGEEPVEVYLSFDDGDWLTAYEVDVFKYIDDWSNVTEWSTQKINFGSTFGYYEKLKGSITECYGMAVEYEVTKKVGFKEGIGFRVGMLKDKKGDYGEFHNDAMLEIGDRDWLYCYNKEPKDFNGYRTMTSAAMNKAFSYSGIEYGLKLYFRDLGAAGRYVRSIKMKPGAPVAAN